MRNNFANLLIDKQSFKEAEEILENLLKEDPEYQDAQSNYNRLNFQQNLAKSAPKSSSPLSITQDNANDHFMDPLAAAFSDEEVDLAGGVTSKQKGKLPVEGLQLRRGREYDKELRNTLSSSTTIGVVNR